MCCKLCKIRHHNSEVNRNISYKDVNEPFLIHFNGHAIVYQIIRTLIKTATVVVQR